MHVYGDVSGIMLGIHHFNNGIGDVVSKITDIHKSCPIRFALEDIYDSESSQSVATSHFGQIMLDNPNRPPSGLFGAWRSSTSIPLAVMTSAYGVPQISPLSTSTELDDTDVYRYFARLIPSDAGTAKAVVDYLADTLNVRHLGMLYVSDPYGTSFHQAIVNAAFARPKGEEITVKGAPFAYHTDVTESKRSIELQIEQLAKSGYRYFFGVIFDEQFELVMDAAVRHGIAGPNNVWILSDGLSTTYLDDKRYPQGSNLAIASQGIGILKAEGGRTTIDGNTGYDRFTKAWYEQGTDNVEYYNCKQPKNNTVGDPSIYYEANGDFFTGKEMSPSAGAVFTYDSAIALGLAACDLYKEKGDVYFNGEELFDRVIEQKFDGASGQVAISPKTTSRDPKSAFFVLYNANGVSDREGGTAFSVKTVATSVPSLPSPNSTTYVEWDSYNSEVFMYSDGTANAPDPLPPAEVNYNYLSIGIRGAGLAVTTLVFVLAVYFFIWMKRHIDQRVVKASQPEFLFMIIVGSILMGSTIIPLSYDDNAASFDGCNTACRSIPWLFCYGFTFVFSALFAKTWRLNNIMANASTRTKMRVNKTNALRPWFALMALNTIILAVWTKVNPLEWVRIDTGLYDQFGRSLESYGQCQSDKMAAYAVPLFIINFTLVIMANYQAYRSRNLSTEFSESKYISIIMASMFQAIVIGLPLIILVYKDPKARFIVLVCIIGALSLTTLCFMFVPKIMAVRESRREGDRPNHDELGSSVRRASITQVTVTEDEKPTSLFTRWVFGSRKFNQGDANLAPSHDEEDHDVVMTGESLCTGTLVPVSPQRE